MTYALLHQIIIVIYLVLPPAVLALAIYREVHGIHGAVAGVVVSAIAGLIVALALNFAYAHAVRGRMTVTQVLLATYFAIGMLMLLRLFDHTVQAGLRWMLRLNEAPPGGWRAMRIVFLSIVRVGILFAIALPYVMACAMVYRPKVLPLDNPQSQLGFNYQPVSFTTSDGMNIKGWWIPAQSPPRGGWTSDWAAQTVIVCHGLASSKSNQLVLARRLPPGGFNVLAFDFRAHGESSGQLTTFGELEKRDVLAAVKWVQTTHPKESQEIFGVGASMGSAALISAAADKSAQGQAIEAVACYAGYDDLGLLARDLSNEYFSEPLNWLLLHVGLPMASAQVGVDLSAYRPADDIRAIWPRPVLLIHGERDEIININRGQALLDAASQPKYHLFFGTGSHNDIVNNETAAKVVEQFFKIARSDPVI